MTIYLGHRALAELDQAQAVIDHHLVACTVCTTNQPCAERRAADRVFLRYNRLPRRTPGLAGGGLEAHAGFGWFSGSQVVADVAYLSQMARIFAGYGL
jgi:hypothetical protein